MKKVNSSKQPTVTILIPCYNEAKTIEKCLQTWINQIVPADEIIVVDDCSKDTSLEILNKYKDKITIVALPKNTGNKSHVQEEGLKHIKTDVFISTDADTLMDLNLVGRVKLAFRDPEVSAFSGYVQSLRFNWLTACREIEYILGQNIHKVAQHNIGYMFVISGCAGAFRTKVFRKYIKFDHDTLTEDLDFTYKIHENNLKIVYDKNAIVYTQDPATLKSYINQVRRWFNGGFQNLVKHWKVYQNPYIAFELTLIYFEGLSFAILLLILPFLNIKLYLLMMGLYLLTNMGIGLYASIIRKRWDLFVYSPLYVFITFINSLIFLEQFFKVVIFRKRMHSWFHPERRAIE